MRNIFILMLIIFTLLSCGDSRTALEKATDLRCECLSQYSEEKRNMLDVFSCIEKNNKSKEFEKLDPMEVAKEMERKCPDFALPLEDLITTEE